MRVVIVGTTSEALSTARLLIERGHEVVILESDRERIEELSENMDCGFVHGDGTRPDILRETDPDGSDVLFSLTDQDQTNILSSLVGRSLGFDRVITSVESHEYEPLCGQLGLDQLIVPSRTISRYLADLVEGLDVLELRTVMKGEARFFSFTARERDAGAIGELDLPDDASIICFYRDGEFVLAKSESRLKKDDHVVILTHSRNLPQLRERWDPEVAGDDEQD